MAIVEAHTRNLSGMQHRADWGGFTFFSDEPAQLGGGEEHPIPIAYFTAGIGFCALTQIVRFAEQMKVPIDEVRARVMSDWGREGSVLAGTVLARCAGFEMDVDITSPAPRDQVAAVIQNAHAGCFAEQALAQALTPTSTATLNGMPLKFDTAPRESSGAPDPRIKHFPVEVHLEREAGVSHSARWKDHVFRSDEPPHLGGNDAHPIPIAYFVASVAFCALTQIVKYAEQLKIPIGDVACRAASHFSRNGSVLGGTVKAQLDRFDLHVDLESDAPPERVASLIRNAHAGCYAQQALVRPIDIASHATLNGRALDYTSYPRRIARS